METRGRQRLWSGLNECLQDGGKEDGKVKITEGRKLKANEHYATYIIIDCLLNPSS